MLFRGGARYHVDITSAEYYAGVTRVAECVPPFRSCGPLPS